MHCYLRLACLCAGLTTQLEFFYKKKKKLKKTHFFNTLNSSSTRNSPTSTTHNRKSPSTVENVVDWQKIPKVEIVQHVDTVEESEKESSGRQSNEDGKEDALGKGPFK